jgi:hypothetical protein
MGTFDFERIAILLGGASKLLEDAAAAEASKYSA